MENRPKIELDTKIRYYKSKAGELNEKAKYNTHQKPTVDFLRSVFTKWPDVRKVLYEKEKTPIPHCDINSAQFFNQESTNRA